MLPPLFHFNHCQHQVSAKTGQNVDEAFLTVVKAAAKRTRDEEPIIPDSLKLSDVKPAAKKGCC